MNKSISINHLEYLGGIFKKMIVSKGVFNSEVRDAVDKVILRIKKNKFKRLTKQYTYENNVFSITLVNNFVDEKATFILEYHKAKRNHEVILKEEFKVKYN